MVTKRGTMVVGWVRNRGTHACMKNKVKAANGRMGAVGVHTKPKSQQRALSVERDAGWDGELFAKGIKTARGCEWEGDKGTGTIKRQRGTGMRRPRISQCANANAWLWEG